MSLQGELQDLPVTGPAEPAGGDAEAKTIAARSVLALAWSRIRRSKVALISLAFIVLVILAAIFAPLLTAIEGQDATTFRPELLDNNFSPGLPLSYYRFPSPDHWLGVEPGTGRDTFARLVYGARVSLIIALCATLVSVVLGTIAGAAAAFYRGPVDTVISRLMDLLLAFPQLLFTLTITPILQERLGKTFLGQGSTLPIVSLVMVLGFFGWPYLGRIVRGQVLSLREREFVDAARALGASPRRIIFREIIPNIVAVVLVYATLTIPVNITAEAALSFLGVGVNPPTASWGEMLNAAESWYQIDYFFLAVPGVALVLTVLAFNLLGDAVRDALDPKASRG